VTEADWTAASMSSFGLDRFWANMFYPRAQSWKESLMANVRTTMHLDVAARVADRLRTNPQVENLLDPAILIAAFDDGCDAILLERLEVTHIMREINCDPPEPADPMCAGPFVAVLIADKSGGSFYTLPDPRIYPTAWPWVESDNPHAVSARRGVEC
jgi:hypothetical protein